MRRRSKKYILFLAFLLFLSSYISSSFVLTYFRELHFPEFLYITRKLILVDNISCYQTNNSFTNINYAPNSIYFYQTTCRKDLSFREACSIEAVARVHPSRNVYVIFLNTISLSDRATKTILKMRNVKVSRINLNNYADGTPIDELPAIIGTVKRKYKTLADLLKIITLYKFGGMVLDLDIIVAKSLDILGNNWFIKEDSFSLSMLKLSNDVIGRAATGMILSNFQRKVDNGYVNLKEAFIETFEEFCTVPNIEHMNNDTCSGFNIYNGKLYHPISYEQRGRYLKPGISEDSYAYQTWWENIRNMPKDSMYSALANTYCPQIFEEFMYEFLSEY